MNWFVISGSGSVGDLPDPPGIARCIFRPRDVRPTPPLSFHQNWMLSLNSCTYDKMGKQCSSLERRRGASSHSKAADIKAKTTFSSWDAFTKFSVHY